MISHSSREDKSRAIDIYKQIMRHFIVPHVPVASQETLVAIIKYFEGEPKVLFNDCKIEFNRGVLSINILASFSAEQIKDHNA